MKFTKFGQSCLLVEEDRHKVLIDPGSYSDRDVLDQKNIEVYLITHSHRDHLDVDLLKEIIKNNPNLKILTNTEVALELDKNLINYQTLESGVKDIGDLKIEAFASLHQPIYPGLPQAKNTSFLVAEKFFHPGDDFFDPQKSVEILALPVSGPWLKLSEAVDYAKKIKPKICLPIHDSNLKETDFIYNRIKQLLELDGIEFVSLKIGEEVIL